MNLTINVNDVSLYPATNPIVGAGTTITIDGNSNVGANTFVQSVIDNTSIVITVSKVGYNNYSTTVSVFDYDMTLEIFMVPEVTNSLDINYQRVYPTFKSYYKPCSLDVYVVQTSSSPLSNTIYYINGVEYQSSNGRSNCVFNTSQPGSYTIGLREISNYFPYNINNFLAWSDVIKINNDHTLVDQGLTIGSLSAVLISDIAGNFSIDEYRPSLNLSKQVTPICDGDQCVTIGSTVTITPDINLNLTVFTSCVNSTLTYELQDFDGNVLETTSYPIVNADPIDPSALQYIFVTTYVGDYKVIATIENCCTECVTEIIIASCETTKVRFVSCNKYSITNCSLSNDIKYTLKDTAGLIINSIENIVIAPTYTSTFETPGDGMYILTINDNNNILSGKYVVAAYCTVLSCITSRIQDILCKDCNCNENCKDYCKDRYEMNRILPLAYLFMNYINKEYKLNSVYSIIDDAKIAELTDVNSVITKLLSFCNNCTSDINDIGNLGTNKDSDCGCN